MSATKQKHSTKSNTLSIVKTLNNKIYNTIRAMKKTCTLYHNDKRLKILQIGTKIENTSVCYIQCIFRVLARATVERKRKREIEVEKENKTVFYL